jgi:hypothetical protein
MLKSRSASRLSGALKMARLGGHRFLRPLASNELTGILLPIELTER